jgi:hypothetical protein
MDVVKLQREQGRLSAEMSELIELGKVLAENQSAALTLCTRVPAREKVSYSVS